MSELEKWIDEEVEKARSDGRGLYSHFVRTLARILFLEQSDKFVEDLLHKIVSLPERIELALQIGRESAQRIERFMAKE